MSALTGLIIGLMAALTIMALWQRLQSPQGQIHRLENRLTILQKREKTTADVNRLLRSIYKFINTSIYTGKIAAAYKGVELLKQAFGVKVVRQDEPACLAAACITALRAGQPDITAALLDAFRPVIKNSGKEILPGVAEQLLLISTVSVRCKQSFLAAKTADILFAAMEKYEEVLEEAEISEALLKAVKAIGLLALRRKDNDLFREIVTRVSHLMFERQSITCRPVILFNILIEWQHGIVRKDNLSACAILCNFMDRMLKIDRYISADVQQVFEEWLRLAGTASLNCQNSLAPLIIEQTLSFAYQTYNYRIWERIVPATADIALLSINRNGSKESFMMIHPLLEIGRRLFITELKIGSQYITDGFRQKALHKVVRQCLIIAEFSARQELIGTVVDTIYGFYESWQVHAGRPNSKSIRKFCQLLHICWMNSGRKMAAKNRTWPCNDFYSRVLISEQEYRRLGFNSRELEGKG